MARLTEVVKLSEETKERLDELKPFESITYNDLIDDMADHYEERREAATAVPNARDA